MHGGRHDNVSPTYVSLNEESRMFHIGRCVPWTMRPLDDASPGRCVSWTMHPLDDASLGRCIPWKMRHLDDASLGRCVSWTMHPLDDASLGRCVPWTTRPDRPWTISRHWSYLTYPIIKSVTSGLKLAPTPRKGWVRYASLYNVHGTLYR
jgi:hypothetical protein